MEFKEFQCENLFFHRDADGHPHYFPCGKCVVCRKIYTRGWTARMFLEAKKYDDIAFVTLTYNDQCLPSDFSLVPKDLYTFCHSLRNDRKMKDRRFRYYGAGEYGGQGFRPHYHLVLFGASANDWDYLWNLWGKGHVKVENPRQDQKTYAYVAGYVAKKLTANISSISHKVPEFHTQSRGIGYNALEWLANCCSYLKKEDGDEVPTELIYQGSLWPVSYPLREKVRSMVYTEEEIQRGRMRRRARLSAIYDHPAFDTFALMGGGQHVVDAHKFFNKRGQYE